MCVCVLTDGWFSFCITAPFIYFQVRASAVFALGTLLDMGGASCRDGVGVDEDCDDDDTEHGQLSPQELKTIDAIVEAR